MHPKTQSFRFKPASLGKFKSESASEAVHQFAPSCRIIGLTRGLFSLIDLIHQVLQKTGPAHVICVTWSAGIKDVHQVRWMLDTQLIQSFNLITDHSYVTRQKKYILSAERLFGKQNIRTSEIHAKFTLIHNQDFKVCIRHSMNLNANKTCESFEIDENPDIFNFYMDFVESIFGSMPKGFTASSYQAALSLDQYFKITKPDQPKKTIPSFENWSLKVE